MKRREIIVILTSIFILVITWIAFNVYHYSVTSTITPATEIQIRPINPSFDISVIDALKKRTQTEASVTDVSSASASPSPTPTQTLTPSPTVQPTQAPEDLGV